VAGVVADRLGIPMAIRVVAVMTLLSGIVVASVYREAPKSHGP
jgi:hypothetical protein